MTAEELVAAADAGQPVPIAFRVRDDERAIIAAAMRLLIARDDLTFQEAGIHLGMHEERARTIARIYGITCSEASRRRRRLEGRSKVDVSALVASGHKASAKAAAMAAARRDEMLPEIRRLAAEGMSTSLVAKALSVSPVTLFRWVRGLDIQFKRKPRASRAKPPAPVREKVSPNAAPPAPVYYAVAVTPEYRASPAPVPQDISPVDAADAVDAALAARHAKARAMIGKQADEWQIASACRLPLREVYRLAAEQRRAAA